MTRTAEIKAALGQCYRLSAALHTAAAYLNCAKDDVADGRMKHVANTVWWGASGRVVALLETIPKKHTPAVVLVQRRAAEVVGLVEEKASKKKLIKAIDRTQDALGKLERRFSKICQASR